MHVTVIEFQINVYFCQAQKCACSSGNVSLVAYCEFIVLPLTVNLELTFEWPCRN